MQLARQPRDGGCDAAAAQSSSPKSTTGLMTFTGRRPKRYDSVNIRCTQGLTPKELEPVFGGQSTWCCACHEQHLQLMQALSWHFRYLLGRVAEFPDYTQQGDIALQSAGEGQQAF